MDVKNDVISYITSRDEIFEAVQLPEPFTLTYRQCFGCALDSDTVCGTPLKIDAVIDYLHDKLHTGHWSAVPEPTRNGYAAACYIKALLLLEAGGPNALRDAIRALDLGILLGGPLPANPDLLQRSAAAVNRAIRKGKAPIATPAPIEPSERLRKYSRIAGEDVRSESLPSLETFVRRHFDREVPMVIKDATQHWPAARKWQHLPYLLEALAERTVPVEVGSQYSDEDWSQRLMTFGEFVTRYYVRSGGGKVGYMAQHDLFRQVPELRNDFSVPDYCAVTRTDAGGDDDDVSVNAWFGPEGTVSSLHYDPKDNLLAQIYGTKQVILFSPADGDNLYPHRSEMLFNTARVDPTEPDLGRFPKFANAKPYKCLLERGDMLYIPRKWWHHVTSLDRSFSVNFWWS